MSVVGHLGAGTFDVSVIWFRSNQFEVLGTGGDSTFGGNDLDNRIVEHLFHIFEVRTGKCARFDFISRCKLREASEGAKRLLSTSNEANIEIDDLFEGESFSTVLTRSCFEHLISEELDRIVDTVKTVLERCEADAEDIDEILYCGGSTRIPKLQELIYDLFNPVYTNSCLVNDDSPALIAATEGAFLMGDQSASKLIHTNENSVGLQIEVLYSDFSQFLLVPWSPLPVKGTTRHLWETEPGCRAVEFQLFSGHCPDSDDVPFLGTISFTELPENRKGQLRVSVRLNEWNEANVTVKELGSGRKQWAVFKVYSTWKHCRCALDDVCCLCGRSRFPPPWEPPCRERGRRVQDPVRNRYEREDL
jgi:heat shock protein 5